MRRIRPAHAVNQGSGKGGEKTRITSARGPMIDHRAEPQPEEEMLQATLNLLARGNCGMRIAAHRKPVEFFNQPYAATVLRREVGHVVGRSLVSTSLTAAQSRLAASS